MEDAAEMIYRTAAQRPVQKGPVAADSCHVPPESKQRCVAQV